MIFQIVGVGPHNKIYRPGSSCRHCGTCPQYFQMPPILNYTIVIDKQLLTRWNISDCFKEIAITS